MRLSSIWLTIGVGEVFIIIYNELKVILIMEKKRLVTMIVNPFSARTKNGYCMSIYLQDNDSDNW